MLQTLKIENVALIDKVTLEMDEKLNVISGETGAGKSIMLDSLSFVFGGRADKTLIRENTSSMKVEAVFSSVSQTQSEKIKEMFDIDCADELFISRELDINGKNTCKINGELVPVAVVKKICSMLVDIHGQSEHLAILNNDYQLQIIDLFSKSSDKFLSDLSEEIGKYKEIENEIKSLGGSESEKQNLIDLYSYQIAEIEKVNITENEFEDLSAEKKEMQQFEKINESLKNLRDILSDSGFEQDVISKVNLAHKSIQQVAELKQDYNALAERTKSCAIELEDIVDTANEILSNNYFDEERFNYVDERLDLIKTMFRKYGGNYQSLMEYYSKTQKSLDNLLHSQERYNELQNEKQKVLDRIDTIQEKLSEERKKYAKILCEKMQSELKTLGMPNAKLDIVFSKISERFSLFGFDHVEFMFSSNLGFELKPLNKVVSGGEMSRVMLAYKIVVAGVDDIHTIVFDEVDSGLSGNIAMVVGEYMARLSQSKQIIAVSHLPQICAMADRNIKVIKFSDKLTTHTKAEILQDNSLFEEIARLMGANLDETGIKASVELKNKCNKYKENLK
ncbi:MAG: DNA repair protein RecN [Candidatus Onthoplasma sp.]